MLSKNQCTLFKCLLLIVWLFSQAIAIPALAQKDEKNKKGKKPKRLTVSLGNEYNFNLDRIFLTLQLKDSTGKRPIRKPKVEVYNLQSKEAYPTLNKNFADNKIELELPINRNYLIKITSDSHEDKEEAFIISLEEEGYEQTLALTLVPKKVVLDYEIVDLQLETDQMLSFAVINKYDESQILIGSRDSRGGRYTVKIRAEGDYNIEIDEAKRYAMYAENTKEKEKGKEIDITLLTEIPMLSIGQQIYLYNVNFEPFSYKLDNNMRRELDRVLVILNQNPNVVIEIGGHTDNYNPRNINLQLSEDRARAVADYLTLSGIAPERLFVKGYGDTKPIENNDTKAGRLRNRRFEITVLGYING